MPWTPGRIVRVFTTERAHVGSTRVVDGLIRLAQEEHLASVTVTRAQENTLPADASGIMPAPGASGARRSSGGANLVVEIVGRAERIEATLPRITALVGAGALAVIESRIYLPASSLSVRDIATPARVTTTPDAPLPEALAALLDPQHPDVRLIPVVDARGMVVGVLTLGRLLEQMDSELAAHLLELGAPERIRAHVLRHVEGRTVGEVMRAPALTVSEDTPFDAAARFLATHQVTRAPVTDSAGRLVGLLSEHTLVAALTAPLLSAPAASSQASPTTTNGQLRAVLGASVAAGGEPLTAGALMDANIPRVPETATWREVAQAIEHGADEAPARLALVVNAAGALRGVIDERDLLARLAGPSAGGALALFRRMFGGALDSDPRLSGGATAQQRAASLAQPARPVVGPDISVAAALAEMVKAHAAGYAVIVDAGGRPEGVLWRSAALHALVGL